MTVKARIHLLARAGFITCSTLALAACDDGLQLPFGQTSAASEEPEIAASGSAQLAGQDVEAPEVFQTVEAGLWDGRPSLGGVWVAHPDAVDPERVLITNSQNGQTVVGALFRRERENPGPALQVSSDAAAALNVIAGQPTELTVVALRRAPEPEPLDIQVAPPEPAERVEPEMETAALALPEVADATAAPADIAATALDPIEIAAAAAIDEAEILADMAASQPVQTAAVAAAPEATPIPVSAPAPAAAPDSATMDRPFVQIGIFSQETNANATADALRQSGVLPTVYDQQNDNGRFWRVVVGPARSASERDTLLATVQGLGFEDAYFVTN